MLKFRASFLNHKIWVRLEPDVVLIGNDILLRREGLQELWISAFEESTILIKFGQVGGFEFDELADLLEICRMESVLFPINTHS